MSRVVKNDHYWDEEEVNYILARSGGKELVEQNRDQFSEGDVKPDDDDGAVELSPEIFEHVKGLSVEDLQKELADNKLSVKGEEVEMRVRLAEYLQAKEDKK